MSSRVYFMKSGKDFKDVSMQSKHKHTKCEYSRRNSVGITILKQRII